MGEGIIVFSVDLELSWGLARAEHAASRRLMSRLGGSGEVLAEFLGLLDRLGLPVTWAIVAATLTDPRDSVRLAILEQALERGAEVCGSGEEGVCIRDAFHHRDAGSDQMGSGWLNPALASQISEAATGHELACHSFCHLDFSRPTVTRQAASTELDLCLEAFSAAGHRRPVSFVFPWNRVAHLDLLAEKGFLAYRAPAARRNLARFGLGYLLDPESNVSRVGAQPTQGGHPLMGIPGTVPISWAVSQTRTRMKAKLALKSLERGGGGLVHFYTHSHDIVHESSRKTLETILRTAREACRREQVRVMTMRQVAEEELAERK